MTTRVAASLWSVPHADQADALARLHAGGVAHVHWDRTDGVFAPAGGFSAARAEALTAEVEGVVAEAHLMVTDPLTEVDAWTTFCELVVVHAEATNTTAALRRIEARGARPAIALARPTPIAAAGTELPVLTMSIDPGYAGSTFDRAALKRIRELRAASGPSRLLGVDGGVDVDLARETVAAGGDWIVSGTSLAGSHDPTAWLAALEA